MHPVVMFSIWPIPWLNRGYRYGAENGPYQAYESGLAKHAVEFGF